MIDENRFTVGKFTLESLTLGMYLSPKVLFREYIQNSTDSIDDAIRQGVITQEESRIVITIDPKEKRIIIEDNGLGIPANRADKVLTDIGNSSKTHLLNRGFRGIGRLAGLSCCETLVFHTTHPGESIGTIVTFDCKKLRNLLVPGKSQDYNLEQVLQAVVSTTQTSEMPESHFFRVILDKAEDTDGILDPEQVVNYISQTAPVPYDVDEFPWAVEIQDAFNNRGLTLEEYNILVSVEGELRPVFKPYRESVLTNRRKKIWDRVRSIKIEELTTSEGDLLGIAWYGLSGLQGTILHDDIKGLRLRKGNILIGDKSTLNFIFKEDRFNGWFQGEIFVLDNNIIPNARRDSFERNTNHDYLMTQLLVLGDRLSRLIRKTSNERQNSQLIETDLLKSSFEKPSKTSLLREHSNTKVLFCEFDTIIGNQEMSMPTKHPILNLARNLTISEKKLLEKVFDTIEESCTHKTRNKIIEAILDRLNIS